MSSLREVTILGVHPALEEVHLIEVRFDPPDADVSWLEFTQAEPDTPDTEWQVPYDEQPVDESAGRWAFFFHFLDVDQPLQTPIGARALPRPTPRPPHLRDFVYEEP